jgi:hydrogenase expression/formation protein HypE
MGDEEMSVVKIAHGGGGKLTEELVKQVFIKKFNNNILNGMEDSAVVNLKSINFAFTTDSYTVKPIFFPGGDIGRLAVCGTVNDLLMRGAKPLFLSSSFIIEEGLEIERLKAIVDSMAAACQEIGVGIIAGDTKVVGKGEADQLFINTSGVGIISAGTDISIKRARPGDCVIISGTIGDHGMAILSTRENFTFDPPMRSDCAPLMDIVNRILVYKEAIRVLRDPTRGGVAEALYNISEASGVGVEIFEDKLPVKPQVDSACTMLGLDLLQLANEGKLIAIVESRAAVKILKLIKQCKYGHDAALIGTINNSGLVTVKTRLGTSRILGRPLGELIPRIC